MSRLPERAAPPVRRCWPSLCRSSRRCIRDKKGTHNSQPACNCPGLEQCAARKAGIPRCGAFRSPLRFALRPSWQRDVLLAEQRNCAESATSSAGCFRVPVGLLLPSRLAAITSDSDMVHVLDDCTVDEEPEQFVSSIWVTSDRMPRLDWLGGF